MLSHGDQYDETIVVRNSQYTLSNHAIHRMLEWSIEKHQVSEILLNWVAKEFNPEHNSTGYFGVVPGRTQLLMIAISEDGRNITTIHFDRTATRHYHRKNYSYFDEINNEAESQI